MVVYKLKKQSSDQHGGCPPTKLKDETKKKKKKKGTIQTLQRGRFTYDFRMKYDHIPKEDKVEWL